MRKQSTKTLLGAFTQVLVALLLLPALSAQTVEGRIKAPRNLKDLSNFVIWVEGVEGDFPPPKDPAVIDQKDLKFVPHVLVIQAGTTVEFPNSDPVSHNVFSISDVKRFNLGLYQRGAVRQVKFGKAGVVELLCNVHLEMSAYIIVTPNPYFAKTEADGTFRIENVSTGTYKLRIWHEKLPDEQQSIEVRPGKTTQVTVDMGS
jgi:plastocyanin